MEHAMHGARYDGGDASMSPLDHLRSAIEHSQAALLAEPDDADSRELAKLVQGLYAIVAARQEDSDRAQGGDPKQMRLLRRASAGRGAGPMGAEGAGLARGYADRGRPPIPSDEPVAYPPTLESLLELFDERPQPAERTTPTPHPPGLVSLLHAYARHPYSSAGFGATSGGRPGAVGGGLGAVG